LQKRKERLETMPQAKDGAIKKSVIAMELSVLIAVRTFALLTSKQAH